MTNNQTLSAVEFAAGSEDELRIVMNVYTDRLLKYTYGIMHDYHLAQDAVQNTFIKAYEKRHTLKKENSLTPWLYRIAYTTALNMLRGRAVLSIFPIKAASDENYIGEELSRALAAISPLDRAVVLGRVLEEMTYAELARIHRKSEPYLRKRYERAVKKLAGLLGGQPANASKEVKSNEYTR